MNDPTTVQLQKGVQRITEVWARSLLKGANPYGQVDGQSVHLIPAKACKGRTGTRGKTFVGYIDLLKGELRFDCAQDPRFHLTVDLSQVPHFAASPGCPDAEVAAASFEAARS
jgi:hypothetical protein